MVKTLGKAGKLRQPYDLQKELQPGGFGMFQNPKPFLLVEGKKLLPFIKLVPGDVEPFKELFGGTDAQKSFCQDTENKEQAIAGIRDNHVREDSVGVSTAFTD